MMYYDAKSHASMLTADVSNILLPEYLYGYSNLLGQGLLC